MNFTHRSHLSVLTVSVPSRPTYKRPMVATLLPGSDVAMPHLGHLGLARQPGFSNTNPKPTTLQITMKPILTICKFLTVVTLAVLAFGCAADLHNKENLATAAGFKPITPNGADQQAILTKLPADKVTRISYKGKFYYVLPDVKANVAYVGGQAEYQAYRQLREQQQLSNDNLMAASMNEDASMNWGAWGGWDAVGPIGFRR